MLVTWLAPFINIWQSGETLEKRVSLFCVVNQGDGSCDGSWYKVIGALGDPIGETVPVIGQVNIKGTVQGNGGWHLLC